MCGSFLNKTRSGSWPWPEHMNKFNFIEKNARIKKLLGNKLGGRGAHRRLRALPSPMDAKWRPTASHAPHLELVLTSVCRSIGRGARTAANSKCSTCDAIRLHVASIKEGSARRCRCAPRPPNLFSNRPLGCFSLRPSYVFCFSKKSLAV